MWVWSWKYDFSKNFIIVWLYWFCTKKYWWVIFGKNVLFSRSHELSGAFTTFPWNFARVLDLAIRKSLCMFFLFILHLWRKIGKSRFLKAFRNEVFSRFSLNSGKIQFSSYFFAGIFKKNICAKFQRKTINSAELYLLQTLEINTQFFITELSKKIYSIIEKLWI